MGDMDAKVGSSNRGTGTEEAMGNEDTGTINSSGERLINFYEMNSPIITGISFLTRKYMIRILGRSPIEKHTTILTMY